MITIPLWLFWLLLVPSGLLVLLGLGLVCLALWIAWSKRRCVV